MESESATPAKPVDGDKALYDSVQELIAKSRDPDRLRETLLPRLAYAIPRARKEWGLMARDPYATPVEGMPGETDPSLLYISPYAKTSAGVTLPITYSATDTGDTQVVLARKWKNAHDHSQGLDTQFVLIGGYMNPPPPGLASNGKPFDRDLTGTAHRELQEESGIVLPKDYRPKSLFTDSRHGISNDPREPTVNEVFHIDATGPAAARPALHAGDDVAQAIWVDARDIRFDPAIGVQPAGSRASRYTATAVDPATGEKITLPILDAMGDYLDRAVTAAHRNSAEAASHPDRPAQIAVTAPTAFGPQADALHREQVAAALASLGTPGTRIAANENHRTISAPKTREVA